MSPMLVELLAITLLHSLWQQGLLALFLSLVLRSLTRWSASSRYLIASLGLVASALFPIVTFLFLFYAGPPAAPASAPGLVDVSTLPLFADVNEPPIPDAPAASQYSPPSQRSLQLSPIAHQVVFLWLIGVCFFGLRFLGGWVYLQRLRWVGIVPPDARWRRLMEELAPKLGVFRPVWLYESRRVTVPTLIGWLRPIVLVPVGIFTGLSNAQIEAILAHELAHVRRHDYLVNLIQSLTDVFYYYSPGVWYLSRLIREEREYCCDDLAVAATGNALALGRALAELAKGCPAPVPVPAVAATGGSLLGRVRRIVLPASSAPAGHDRSALAALTALLLAAFSLMLLAQSYAHHGHEGETRSEPLTPATHQAYLLGRKVVKLHAEDVTLREACEQLQALSGLRIQLPAEAAEQRVSLNFEDVSANMILVSIFNLLEMDHQIDPVSGIFHPAYWPGSGPRPDQVVRLSLAYFHTRQAMFRGLKHSLHWTSKEVIPLSEGLRRLAEISGITFALHDPQIGELPVEVYLPNGTVRQALHAMVKPKGLKYQYLDDSTILIGP